MRTRLSLLLVLMLLPLLAACGGAAAPTATPFVRVTEARATATPLPALATSVPAGFPDNPLRLMLVPVDRAAAEILEPQLENAILQASAVTVDVVLAEDDVELLTALCDTTTKTLTAAWVNGITYAAARARNCGDAVMQLQRGTQTGESALVLMSTTLESQDIRSLRGQVFCRPGMDDFYGWLVPSLMLRAAELDVSALADVRDYPDTGELLSAVASGECAGAGIAETLFADVDTDSDGIRIAATSVTFPYGVLMYPFPIPLAARLSLNEGLPQIETSLLPAAESPAETTPEAAVEATAEATSEATPDPTADYTHLLAPFFGEGKFVRLEPEDLAELDAFLEATGFNFAQPEN